MKETNIYIPAEKYLSNHFVRYSSLKQGRPENSEVSKYGTRLDRPEMLRQLPPIGEQIVLTETVLTGRISANLDKDILYESYIVNAMGEPQIFKVTSYSEGIRNGLSLTNKMYVEFRLGALNYCNIANTFFMAHLITSGYLNWIPAEEYYAKRKEMRAKKGKTAENKE